MPTPAVLVSSGVWQSAEEVVRRLTITATNTGVDQQTASLTKLADASNTLATVTDTNAKRALSAEAAYNRQTLFACLWCARASLSSKGEQDGRTCAGHYH
jgi:hypothetical protein